MLMGMAPQHDAALDTVLRGFLDFVRNGPAFVTKVQGAIDALVDALDKEYAAKSARLESLDTELAQAIEQANATLTAERAHTIAAIEDDLLRSTAQADTQKKALDEDIAALVEKRAALQQAIDDQQRVLVSVQTETNQIMRERETALDAINGQLRTAQQQHQELKADLAALVKKIGG